MKKSVAYDHFPQVVVRDNRFWLFNPILKKRYENRPEERVRLQWVEYLLHQTDVKKTRIGFETPVKHQKIKNTLRADLVLYSDQMAPQTLIECKSNKIKLNQRTAIQAARYNKKIDAENIILTNGVEDYWFKQTGESIEEGVNFFSEKSSFKNIERDHHYWCKRGFCSDDMKIELKDWLVELLNSLWSSDLDGKRQHLDFKQSLVPVPMNQYYKLCDIDSGRRIAISITGTDSSDTHLIGILNEDGSNRAVLSVNLDKVYLEEQEAIFLFRNRNRIDLTSKKTISKTLTSLYLSDINQLPYLLMKFFD